VRIDATASQLQPRTGEDGCLQHWHRGLISAVQSWARGCKAHVVYMLIALVSTEHGFGIEAEVRERLAGEQLRDAETTYMCVVVTQMCCLNSLKTPKNFRLRRFRLWRGACGEHYQTGLCSDPGSP
jgi:hypothetical protein